MERLDCDVVSGESVICEVGKRLDILNFKDDVLIMLPNKTAFVSHYQIYFLFPMQFSLIFRFSCILMALSIFPREIESKQFIGYGAIGRDNIPPPGRDRQKRGEEEVNPYHAHPKRKRATDKVPPFVTKTPSVPKHVNHGKIFLRTSNVP